LYPHDLGIATGGNWSYVAPLRLVQLLAGDRLFSAGTFESQIHRDDVHRGFAASVARGWLGRFQRRSGSWPTLDQLRDWDLRYRADQPAYLAGCPAGALITPYRGSPLTRLGGGEGGITPGTAHREPIRLFDASLRP
jgi:hypothetical protein